eukprot:CAMPEP_0202908360 /NCGR_PEP_ID=MMETSP1392-20130828/45772_1 /ASSEMBLY_ACC=CAM_ASM_000868 /TAXON_ID=225041 /ORGANISM="Chlamydomonas chlamydogama, Strain SAG 11-48b" /LENGTH=284 /DNA_ID=CAMNT_0049597645 /DNA_START=109 /DNA_END=959 /DNA_ORIENTATION=-
MQHVHMNNCLRKTGGQPVLCSSSTAAYNLRQVFRPAFLGNRQQRERSFDRTLSEAYKGPASHQRSFPRRNVAAQATPQPLSTGSIVKTSNSEFRWGSYVSKHEVLELAVDEAVENIKKSIGQDSEPELAIVFITTAHGEEFEDVIPLLRERLPSLKHIFGCSGYGVVGGGEEGPQEVEGEHGFSLTLGQLPGVEMKLLHTLRSSIPDAAASPEEWADFVGVPHDTPRNVSFVILADPRFAQVKDMIEGLDYAFPDSPKIGGILSSGARPKGRAMFAWSAEKQRR